MKSKKRKSDAVDDGRSDKPNKVLLATTPVVNDMQNDEVNRNIYLNLWYIIYKIFTVCQYVQYIQCILYTTCTIYLYLHL